MGEVLQHYCVAAELIAEGQVFQELGDGLDAVHGGVVEDVEGAWVSISRAGTVQSWPVRGM